MLIEAATALNLDLQRSLLVGDRLNGLLVAAAAVLPNLFLVLSGHCQNARASTMQWYEKRREAGETVSASDCIC